MTKSCNITLFVIVFSQWAWQAQAGSSTKIEYYSITGSTVPELRLQMRQKGKNGFFGYTHYNLSYSYKTRSSDSGCVLSSSDIDIEWTFTMPKWENIADAPIEMQQSWKTFYDALWRHEQGHKAISQTMYSEVRREFYRARSQNNCASFAGVLANIKSLAKAKAVSKNAEYDARTNHGISEGVVLSSIVRASGNQTPSQQDSSPSNRSTIAWYWWFIGAIGLLLFLKR